jgi:hypothetical protein
MIDDLRFETGKRRCEDTGQMNCGLQISGTAPGNRRPPSAELSDCGLNEELRRDHPAWAGIPRRRGRLSNKPNLECSAAMREALVNKRIQFREVGPIPGGPTAPNKPNFLVPEGRADRALPLAGNALRRHYEPPCCAKQTQFRPLCRSGDRRSQGPIVRSEADFPRTATGRDRQGVHAAGRTSGANKPNLPAGAEIESLTLVG